MEPSSAAGDAAAPREPRPEEHVPVLQLTRALISTYNHINQNYYNKRKLAQDGQALRKKKGVSGSKKVDVDYQFLAEEEIFNGRYKVLGKKLGMGSFGQVVEAQDMQTGQEVAIKIVKKKKNFTNQAQLEISILESLHSTEHAGKKYIVQLKDKFVHKGHQCLVFERLDSTLYDVLKRTMFKGVSLNLVRKITRQILVALEYLANPSVNVIHCDLKPENILLVHSSRSKLKIIDFGSSCLSQSQLYQYIQSRFYRSPEVLLGTPYTTAIDMWSLACIMVEMHTGKPLFGGTDQHDQLRRMVNVLGMPSREVIEHANPTYRRDYFNEHVVGDGVVEYTLKARKTASAATPPGSHVHDTNAPTSLVEIVGANTDGPGGIRHMKDDHSPEDYRLFVDLLQRMLDYNPATRITPAQALLHPFVAASRQSSDTRERKKAKSMRTMQMRDPYDRGSASYYDPADSHRIKLRRLHENPGVGH